VAGRAAGYDGRRGPLDVVPTLEQLRAEERIGEAVELRALAVLLADDGQVAPDLELRLVTSTTSRRASTSATTSASSAS
jgi:hypothetical protein